jgi:hypothetical protein
MARTRPTRRAGTSRDEPVKMKRTAPAPPWEVVEEGWVWVAVECVECGTYSPIWMREEDEQEVQEKAMFCGMCATKKLSSLKEEIVKLKKELGDVKDSMQKKQYRKRTRPGWR